MHEITCARDLMCVTHVRVPMQKKCDLAHLDQAIVLDCQGMAVLRLQWRDDRDYNNHTECMYHKLSVEAPHLS
jgi:hypothetical protein